jgi:hypothetical protein
LFFALLIMASTHLDVGANGLARAAGKGAAPVRPIGDWSSGGDQDAKSSYRQGRGIAAGQAWPLNGGLHEPAFLTTGITTASEL